MATPQAPTARLQLREVAEGKGGTFYHGDTEETPYIGTVSDAVTGNLLRDNDSRHREA
jgi:hypothetical protein